MEQSGAATARWYNCRQRAAHIQLHGKVTDFTVSCCFVENYSCCVQHEIRLQFQLFLIEFFIKIMQILSWLCCNKIHQLLFCCISDKVAACRIKPHFLTTSNHVCHQIDQDWNPKDYNFKVRQTNVHPSADECQILHVSHSLQWSSNTQGK